MPRSNSPKRRIQQRAKHHVEDTMARRAIKRSIEQSYRDEASAVTIMPDGQRIIRFTDPSYSL